MAKYYYRMDDVPEKEDAGGNLLYLTLEDVKDVRIYEENDPEIQEELNDEHSDLWCVYDFWEYSTEPAECKDIDDAREKIVEAHNFSIFEYEHDL